MTPSDEEIGLTPFTELISSIGMATSPVCTCLIILACLAGPRAVEDFVPILGLGTAVAATGLGLSLREWLQGRRYAFICLLGNLISSTFLALAWGMTYVVIRVIR